jgi:hypothetical protein
MNMVRVSLAVVSLLAAFVGGGLARQSADDCIITDNVQVRSGPSLAFDVVTVVRVGDCFDVRRVVDTTGEGRWVQLAEGQWIEARHIALSDLMLMLSPIAVTPTPLLPTSTPWLPITNTPRPPEVTPVPTSARDGLRWRVVIEVYAYP